MIGAHIRSIQYIVQLISFCEFDRFRASALGVDLVRFLSCAAKTRGLARAVERGCFGIEEAEIDTVATPARC